MLATFPARAWHIAGWSGRGRRPGQRIGTGTGLRPSAPRKTRRQRRALNRVWSGTEARHHSGAGDGAAAALGIDSLLGQSVSQVFNLPDARYPFSTSFTSLRGSPVPRVLRPHNARSRLYPSDHLENEQNLSERERRHPVFVQKPTFIGARAHTSILESFSGSCVKLLWHTSCSRIADR